MGVPVVTVASGGMPVIDVTATTPKLGLPVTEAANKRGIAVTKVAATIGGLPVTFVSDSGGGSGLPTITGIVFDGDSTTQEGGEGGGGTVVHYPTWFQTITGVPSSKIGVSGNRISDVIARYPTDARPLAATKNTYLIMIGANHADSAEAMWSALTTLCTMAKADFARVIIATVLPRVSQPADIPDFIVMVQTNWASIADGMVDHIGPPAIFPISTYYLYDGLHQTARGSVRAAENVRAKLGFPYIATDGVPNAFSFTDVTGVATSTVTVSGDKELLGMTAPAAFTVTGGTLVVNGVDMGASGTVQPYDMVAAKITSSASFTTAVNAVVTIGGVADTFTVTTGAAAGSTIVWATPTVSGTGTYTNSNRTFQGSSNDWLIKCPDAITGKKLLAYRYDALAGTYNGCGISSGTPPNMAGTGFGICVLHGAGLYGNGVNIGGLTVAATEYVGLAIDTVAKRLWATKDGVTFFDPAGRTKAAVEAGTGGVNIAYVIDHGPTYPAAESAFTDGNGSRFTLQTAWPWTALAGYTYHGA